MSKILGGLDGVLCQMDDILIFGRDTAEHNSRVIAVLKRIEAAGVTLNPEKCEFAKPQVTFLGHVIDESGIHADPNKTTAIINMCPPTSVTELRRFLGMINQLGKFTPNLAQLTQPLRELLSTNTQWLWGPAQAKAFDDIKAEISKQTTLALYTLDAPTKISADASSHGLGAVLLQQFNSQWKPVAFASRSMTETERRYAQIEKEALATTWACEKFASYILGKSITIETDHKPLVPLLGTKSLDSLPPRVLRFRLRLDRFQYTIIHVPGKQLYIADTLSRAPVSQPTMTDSILEMLAEMAASSYIEHLPASSKTLDKYCQAQNSDLVCSLAKSYCSNGWPHKADIQPNLKPFWEKQGELTVQENLLLCGSRIVVPEALQKETLEKLHQGHQGIHRCRLRAQSAVWWPGLMKQIAEVVKKCPECARDTTPNQEPLMSTALPQYPWQRVGTDLFTLDGANYLIMVDYFSRYLEVIKLKTTTSQSVITAMKSIFTRYGIPEVVVSDNGPQFSSSEFTAFSTSYNFSHITSSPHHPRSNGMAERAVKTAKSLLKNSKDHYLSLLSYRATPLPWCKLSPAELLMGRRLRTDVPQTSQSLTPQWPYLSQFQKDDHTFKDKQKHDFDRRHRVRDLPELPDSTDVWVTTNNNPIPGRVVTSAAAPRSFVVQTPSGNIRRNRSHLNIIPNTHTNDQETSQPQNRIQTRSQTGTLIIPPNRL